MRRRQPGAGTARGGDGPVRGPRAKRRRLCLGVGGAASGVGRPTVRAAGGRRGRKDREAIINKWKINFIN
jgi:hypothetical protein